MSDVIALIATLMHQKGLSQAELAELSGLHRSNLCRFLAGETDIRLSSLISLLNALGIDLTEQLKLETNRHSLSSVELKRSSVGAAIETLLEHSDSITKKTVIGSLVVRARSVGHNAEVARALKVLGEGVH